jgi:hypothetical protein
MPADQIKILMTALLPVAAAGSVSFAAPISPGGITEDLFTSLADRPELNGQLVASQTIPVTLQASNGAAVYSLNILNQVLRNPSDHTLVFTYRILNPDSASAHVIGIDRVEGGSFTGFSTDVASLLDGGGQTSPPLALRSQDGAQVTFDFDDSASRISAGGSSFSFLLKTDATHFDVGGQLHILAFTATSDAEGSDRIASGAATVSGYQPSAGNVIPLPAAAIVGLPTAAAVALFAFRQRRSRAA